MGTSRHTDESVAAMQGIMQLEVHCSKNTRQELRTPGQTREQIPEFAISGQTALEPQLPPKAPSSPSVTVPW